MPPKPERGPERAFERAFERALFASRWVQAPLYAGLALSLLLLLGKFAMTGYDLVLHGLGGSEDHLIVAVLGLVDVTLLANLVVMVIFAGYENFVSRFDDRELGERLGWMGQIGFSDLKVKLMASIAAISAIHLLEDFMNVAELTDRALLWRAGLHLLFVVSGVLLAWMDRVSH